MTKYYLLIATLSSTTILTANAQAQDKPAGLMQGQAATSGATNVAQEGFQAAEKPAESKDSTEANLSAGGVLSGGNSRSISFTAAGDLRVRRANNQFSAAIAANYGRARADKDSPVETTVENYQGRARYDYFVSDQLALFVALSLRRDRFQGLDLRLNLDPGLAYYFIDVDKHQLWAELGYDLQHDLRRQEAIDEADEAGLTLEESETRHHARAFVGYDNKLSETVAFRSGLEFLLGLSPFEDDVTEETNWQLNFDAGLTASISEKFSVATTLNLKHDNNPLPGIEKTDVITALNLVYRLY